MNWIYLSPHLDDIALSCGGLVWEQTQQGDAASIWTICAGDPPDEPFSPFAQAIHARWQTEDGAPQQRRQEDLISCAWLGASAHHFSIPDCIYRRADAADDHSEYLYASEEALFSTLHPAEAHLVQSLSQELAKALPSQAEVVCPLAIGGHVDHRLTRVAAENLNRPLWYYADYPYVTNCAGELDFLRQAGWQAITHSISPLAIHAWARSVAAHASQISTFWSDLTAMQVDLQAYGAQFGGILLWRAR